MRRKALPIPKKRRQPPYYFKWNPITHDAIRPPKKDTKALHILSPSDLRNRHEGETIFVLGNGPSVKEVLKFKDYFEKTICISIYVAYWLIPCDYVLFCDLLGIDAEIYEELLSLDSYIFTKDFTTKIEDFTRYFNKIPTKGISNDGILSNSFEGPFYNGGGSVFLAINLAYLFGAKNIALLGIDMDSGEHFYDNMSKFHNKLFYKYVNPGNMARNPNLSAYRGGERVASNMEKVKKFLQKRNVRLFNCSKRSIVGGTYKPLKEFVRNGL